MDPSDRKGQALDDDSVGGASNTNPHGEDDDDGDDAEKSADKDVHVVENNVEIVLSHWLLVGGQPAPDERTAFKLHPRLGTPGRVLLQEKVPKQKPVASSVGGTRSNSNFRAIREAVSTVHPGGSGSVKNAGYVIGSSFFAVGSSALAPNGALLEIHEAMTDELSVGVATGVVLGTGVAQAQACVVVSTCVQSSGVHVVSKSLIHGTFSIVPVAGGFSVKHLIEVKCRCCSSANLGLRIREWSDGCSVSRENILSISCCMEKTSRRSSTLRLVHAQR